MMSRSVPKRLTLVAVAIFTAATGCAVSASSSASPLKTTSVGAAPTGAQTPTLPPSYTSQPVDRSGSSWWRPTKGLSWHIQYTGTPATTSAQVVNLDGADISPATVATYKAQGKKAICYFNAGAWEDWRGDAQAFPPSVLGSKMDEWRGERWLDVRRHDVLLPLMAARMDVCRSKGFDAVDPDNVDGYDNNTGFTLTKVDARNYLRALTQLAHERGLAIGLKNSVDLVADLANDVDFAVNEECLEHDECGEYRPLLQRGKAVFHVEYAGTPTTVCSRVPAGFSTVIKRKNLDGSGSSC